MVNKFLKQKELLSHMLKGQEEQALRQNNELQAGLTLMPTAWRLYLSKEVGRKGSGVGMILLGPDEELYSISRSGGRKQNPATEEARKYREEIMDATALFHRFQITHLPKKLNFKAEVLTGLTTIKLEFLNQEVLVGIKTRPLVEVGNDGKEGKATSKVQMKKPNYNWETSESN
ncbi:hypothetical protein Tco_1555930 [Tanacetum coccineum]